MVRILMVIDTACELGERHPLRAYDAIQLAAASLANRSLVNGEQRRFYSFAQTTG
jgi:predicted nucleic acid-binding protein